MLKLIDDYLNRTTMYRLILYYLIGLIIAALVLSYYHFLALNPVAIILSTLFLVLFSGFVNDIFSRVFEAPTNVESVYITALILALIITPVKSTQDFIFLGWAAVLSMASKYILAIKYKHVFNPVAIAVTLTAIGINQSASWWVGNLSMLPFVIFGGLLIVRKIRREDMVFSFLLAAIASTIVLGFTKNNDLLNLLDKVLLHSPLFFFAFVMLTEPLTTPPIKFLQIIYGLLVGILFSPQVHLNTIYSTPELTLIVGNVFSYLVSPKDKLILKLKNKIQTTPDTYDFIFFLKNKLSFVPGQYMEWTLPHKKPDDRGNRRYFTLASSPTEEEIRIGVKFYNRASSFKKNMLAMDDKTPIVASQRAGDFTLPKNKQQKLVFMAGGIGITPFRSMIKYLTDKNEKRDIYLIYSNKETAEIIYKNIFDEAVEKLGIKVVYTLTDKNHIPSTWSGETGRVDEIMIKNHIPDFQTRIFYLSGPHTMVNAFRDTLIKIGVSENSIKTDFFPGFA